MHKKTFLPIVLKLLIFSLNLFSQNTTFLGYLKTCKHNVKESNITLNLQKQDSCYIGLKLPAISAKTIYDENINTDYIKNKVVIINIWSLWCGPCIAELPGLNDLVYMYKDKNVVFIALTKENKESIQKFFNRGHSFNFKIIADAKKIYYGQLDSFGFPRTIIIDKKGVIRKVFSGGINSKKAPQLIKKKIIPVLEKLIHE